MEVPAVPVPEVVLVQSSPRPHQDRWQAIPKPWKKLAKSFLIFLLVILVSGFVGNKIGAQKSEQCERMLHDGQDHAGGSSPMVPVPETPKDTHEVIVNCAPCLCPRCPEIENKTVDLPTTIAPPPAPKPIPKKG